MSAFLLRFNGKAPSPRHQPQQVSVFLIPIPIKPQWLKGQVGATEFRFQVKTVKQGEQLGINAEALSELPSNHQRARILNDPLNTEI